MIVIRMIQMTPACSGGSIPLVKILLPWLFASACIPLHLKRFAEKSRLLGISVVKRQVFLKDASFLCLLHCKKRGTGSNRLIRRILLTGTERWLRRSRLCLTKSQVSWRFGFCEGTGGGCDWALLERRTPCEQPKVFIFPSSGLKHMSCLFLWKCLFS